MNAVSDHDNDDSDDKLPQSLHRLLKEPDYPRLKQRLIEHRTAFEQNPCCVDDLEAFKRGDNNHEYTCLKGLIPKSLVGKPSSSGKPPWQKSETFFTNYEDHHPADYILSATADSLIINNGSSYDVRQYTAQYDPDCKDRTASAGMSYVHLLVIPRQKLYNVVSLNDTVIIEEMISHFKTFLTRADAIDIIITHTRLALNLRLDEVITGYAKKDDTSTAIQRTAEFTALMQDVNNTADALAQSLRSQKVREDDFFFGFHAAPDASIGHLHMHVLLAPSKFRRYSTAAHDWKTIPAEAVIEVIGQGGRRRTERG